jgi:flagellar motor switch protein FliN/FliY
MSESAQRRSEELIQHFADAASAVLSQISGETLQARPLELEPATDAATVLQVEIEGSLAGTCEIALTAAMTARFAALLTGEDSEASSNEIDGETREAAIELFQQICGNAADRLRRAYGPLEVRCQAGERSATSELRRKFSITRGVSELAFEFNLVQRRAGAEEEAQPTASAASLAKDSAERSSGTRNLDLLLDIELGVSLRFGSRQMLLKEILDLCSGSLVELDQRVQDPVDLLIDGRLIAQGEVVVVGGNYGLRITRVASAQEKIACLP